MKKSINLAFGKKKVDKVFKKAFVVSVAVFVAVVTISLGLIIYRLILNTNFQNLEGREQQLNQQLLTYIEKRDKFLETKSRLSEARNILDKRAPTTVRLNTMTEFVPTTSTITSLDGNVDQMSLELTSEDLKSLNELIEQTLIEVSEDKQKGIQRVEMEAFGLNPSSSSYNASFTVTFE